jgi:hypothetical protein
MAISRGITTAAACFAVLIVALGSSPLNAFREDTEAELLPRMQREHDLVKKAKYEIRLGRLKLLQGATACEKDDHDGCSKSLSAYLELMNNSWKDLKSSGRNAVKQSSGFKELDIALREDANALNDLKHRMPLEDRAALDPVIQEVETIHDEDIAALFPSGGPRPREDKPAPGTAPHFVTGGIE